MRQFRLSLLQLVIYIGIFLNIERVDIGGYENFLNLNTFVYIITGIAVGTAILIPNEWTISTNRMVAFWLVVYAGIKINNSTEWPIYGQVYTLITITEIIMLLMGIVFTKRVLRDMESMEEIIANIRLVDLSSRVKSIDEAAHEIKVETARSRRYQRPFSVVTIQLDTDTIQSSIDYLSKDIIRTMLSRYSISSLIRAIDQDIRRPDLIIDNSNDNQIILLLPETGREGAQAMFENLQKIAHKVIGKEVELASASFPEDAVTFEELIIYATEQLVSNAK